MRVSSPKSLWNTLVLSLLLAGSAAQAGDARVKIHVTLFPAGSFVAESKSLSIGQKGEQGGKLFARNISLQLDTLKTGISLRDQHMRENYFDTARHPHAVLTRAVAKDGKLVGDLNIRGVTKRITGSYEMSGDEFVGKFKTKLSDFQIPPAKYLGVGVQDEVEVEVILPAR